MLNQSIDSQVKASMLGIFARAVASDELTSSPEVKTLHVTVTINHSGDHDVDLEMFAASGMPLGGNSL